MRVAPALAVLGLAILACFPYSVRGQEDEPARVPSFVLHYATPDLETLPEMLVQRIGTGKYRSAVVGACPSDAKVGFSNYRIAVLLFE